MEHARALAESEATFPPIIVSRATMRVIDGMHRLHAGILRGQDDIEVQFFDGDEGDAFVLAVEANIAHGLPLSLPDRRAAAARILNSHPQWSDRMIASIVGLSAKTVGAIRRSSTEGDRQPSTRIGRDGHIRPLNCTEGRRIASELMINNPNASLRKIANEAGISVGTAYDVRERLRRGESPFVLTRPEKEQRKNQLDRDVSASRRSTQVAERITVADRVSILNNLKKDPSLRFAEAGRILLRLLHVLAISETEWEWLIDSVPAHCTSLASDAARVCADTWQEFAEKLERP